MVIITLTLFCILLWQKNRNKKNLLCLHEALDKLSALRWSLHYENEQDSEHNTRNVKFPIFSPVISETGAFQPKIEFIAASASLSKTEQLLQLKKQLRNELLLLADENSERPSVSDIILSSAACAGLREYLERDMPVPENSTLWEELEATVSLASVHFRERINLLTGGKLKLGDYHTVLLLKCGFTPTQISKLLGRAKSSIGSKRESLSVKLFGEKLDLKTTDKLIRLL